MIGYGLNQSEGNCAIKPEIFIYNSNDFSKKTINLKQTNKLGCLTILRNIVDLRISILTESTKLLIEFN
jgi:hypothetical protein